jgi:hypothetical protein
MPLTIRETTLRLQIEGVGSASPEQGRRLVRFAWECVRGTPLSNGLTPLALLRGRSRLQNALLAVGCWLGNEPLPGYLQAMHDEVFEAALGVGRFESDMTGLRAACWSVFELYQAATAAETGELQAVARKTAWSALLACRSDDDGATPAALDYQERLFRQAFAS